MAKMPTREKGAVAGFEPTSAPGREQNHTTRPRMLWCELGCYVGPDQFQPPTVTHGPQKFRWKRGITDPIETLVFGRSMTKQLEKR